MTTKEMLEQRHTLYLEWVEPLPAIGPEGNELPSGMQTNRALVRDCVNYTRWVHANLPAAAKSLKPNGTDEELLDDFMAVHWCNVAE